MASVSPIPYDPYHLVLNGKTCDAYPECMRKTVDHLKSLDDPMSWVSERKLGSKFVHPDPRTMLIRMCQDGILTRKSEKRNAKGAEQIDYRFKPEFEANLFKAVQRYMIDFWLAREGNNDTHPFFAKRPRSPSVDSPSSNPSNPKRQRLLSPVKRSLDDDLTYKGDWKHWKQGMLSDLLRRNPGSRAELVGMEEGAKIRCLDCLNKLYSAKCSSGDRLHFESHLESDHHMANLAKNTGASEKDPPRRASAPINIRSNQKATDVNIGDRRAMGTSPRPEYVTLSDSDDYISQEENNCEVDNTQHYKPTANWAVLGAFNGRTPTTIKQSYPGEFPPDSSDGEDEIYIFRRGNLPTWSGTARAFKNTFRGRGSTNAKNSSHRGFPQDSSYGDVERLESLSEDMDASYMEEKNNSLAERVVRFEEFTGATSDNMVHLQQQITSLKQTNDEQNKLIANLVSQNIKQANQITELTTETASLLKEFKRQRRRANDDRFQLAALVEQSKTDGEDVEKRLLRLERTNAWREQDDEKFDQALENLGGVKGDIVRLRSTEEQIEQRVDGLEARIEGLSAKSAQNRARMEEATRKPERRENGVVRHKRKAKAITE